MVYESRFLKQVFQMENIFLSCPLHSVKHLGVLVSVGLGSPFFCVSFQTMLSPSTVFKVPVASPFPVWAQDHDPFLLSS